MDNVKKLRDELGRIASRSPEAQRIITLKIISEITSIVSGEDGIGNLLNEGKISIIPGSRGTAEDAERAEELVKLLTMVCNTAGVLSGKGR